MTQITEHLLNLSIDEILNEFASAGISNINKHVLKTILVLNAQPELIQIKISRSVKAKKTPITPEDFRQASVKIHQAYLDSYKSGDRKKQALTCQTLLSNIDKLSAWPRQPNGIYNDDWLNQTRQRIQKNVDSIVISSSKITSIANNHPSFLSKPAK